MTDTDKELLELAARAAGIECEWDGNERNMLRAVSFREYTNYERWNPLTDDGDALRLAVKLKLDVRFESGGALPNSAEAVTARLAATRRAITRAAAEIGREMP